MANRFEASPCARQPQVGAEAHAHAAAIVSCRQPSREATLPCGLCRGALTLGDDLPEAAGDPGDYESNSDPDVSAFTARESIGDSAN